MSVIKRTGQCIVVVLPLLLAACDQVRALLPQSDDTNARYQLQWDDQGRVVRLDKVTGEVAILKGGALVPMAPSNQRSRPGVGERIPVASTSANTSTPAKASTPANASEVAQQAEVIPPLPIAVPSNVPEVAPPIAPQLPIGTRVTIIRPSPVYLTAGEDRSLLEVLRSGAVGTVLRTEGEWYLISFESPRWGRRVGYLKSTAVDYGQQPLDLSVPEAK